VPDQEKRSPFDFLRNKPALAVTAVLAVEIALFYINPSKEFIPSPPPLEQFQGKVGNWVMTRQFGIDAETQNLLKADDTLTRDYEGPNNIELFVAFFKSQRAGVTPHSPKLCLPANGFTEESSRIVSVRVPGEALPIPVNRYIVSMGEDRRELVLYWFQSAHRVTADEYLSKAYLILDSLRYRRSDEALVRVIAKNFTGGNDSKQEAEAMQFVQDLYQPLRQQIWFSTKSAAVLP
jgi:EpsI family protein